MYLQFSSLQSVTEVSMRGYNIYSFFQATEMTWVSKGDTE
jgi:hypothetical protein